MTRGGLSGLVPSCTDAELDKGKDQQRLDASSYTCSICFELLLDPVVGAYEGVVQLFDKLLAKHSVVSRGVLSHAAHVPCNVCTLCHRFLLQTQAG